MAKFCISGKDQQTGMFYYQRAWGSAKCICNTWSDWCFYNQWYQVTPEREFLSDASLRSIADYVAENSKKPL